LSQGTVSLGWQKYLEFIQQDLPHKGFSVQLGSQTKTSLGGIPLFFTPSSFNPDALLDGYLDTSGDFTNYILFNVCQLTSCN
jgi:hypothetical protein